MVAGLDMDKSCRYAYEENNKQAKFLDADVSALTGEILADMYPKSSIKLLAGCAPCQPFSTYSLGKTEKRDVRWSLLLEFGRLVGELEPEIVTMENVPKVEKHPVFLLFLKQLTSLGYSINYSIVDCAAYGIPQSRKRLVLLASLLGPISLRSADPRKDRPRTVSDAIRKLEKLAAGGSSKRDRMHRASSVSALNMRRLKASVPGGTWRDWDRSLVASCHQAESGETFPSVYGRMSWDALAPTVTTQFFGFGNGRFGHPEQNRALSLREGALLQTFPATYRFVRPDRPIYFKAIGRMIGNAVPVRLGQVIGESIITHVQSEKKSRRSRSSKPAISA